MPDQTDRGMDSSADTALAPPESRTPADAIRFTPGTLLAGRYRIVAPVGKGGMGEVYRADDIRLGQPVALKFLPAALGPNVRTGSRSGPPSATATRGHPNCLTNRACFTYALQDLSQGVASAFQRFTPATAAATACANCRRASSPCLESSTETGSGQLAGVAVP